MRLRTPAIALVFVAVVMFLPLRALHAAEGEEMNVHNETGHTVVAFLFTDDHEHDGESGGVQFAALKNHESAVAHVNTCKFAITLVDHEDVWHAEFHDCHSTDMTFTATTGHAQHDH